jgi:tRNA threonylcarbamoyladenosine biosynthesis protein TsaB
MDTATPVAVVAVVDDGRVRGSVVLTETKRHAENLLDAIDGALGSADVKLEDINGVGVGRGPGSFIGVRTGIATAKGIALARSIPLVGVSTLISLAASVNDLPEGQGLAVLDAKRGEVYAGVVENVGGRLRLVDAPSPLAPTDAATKGEGMAFLVGSGVTSSKLIALTGPTPEGVARALAWCAVVDEVETLVPDYARPPDAKLPSS